MPGKYDNIPLDSPFFDKRVKLLPCQKENLKRLNDLGMSQRQLARMYKVSRRLIQFILDPDKKKRDLERRRERGGSNIYYVRSEHSEAMKRHRDHKKEVFDR